ncbi:MAG: hypothetical protein AAF721_05775 [Myxococcota bacterium]
MSIAPTPARPDSNAAVRDKYVARLRARLARPKITVADARDGMLDCYVSTYHAGVEHGLKGILGVDASPDEVAKVTDKMFRDRLRGHGVTFEDPTIEALNDIKDELDGEFHFSELPVEVSATHDQVCSLLLAKADGLLEHHGDRSVLGDTPKPAPSATPTRRRAVPPPRRVGSGTSAFNPAMAPTAPPVDAAPPSQRGRSADTATENLRLALAAYLGETAEVTMLATPTDLLARLNKALRLGQSLADISAP